MAREPVGVITDGYAFELMLEALHLASLSHPDVQALTLTEDVDSNRIGLQCGVIKYDPAVVHGVPLDDLVEMLQLASLQQYLNVLPACSVFPETPLQ